MTTDAKLCFIDRDGVFQVIHGAAEDARAVMESNRAYNRKIRQQMIRMSIQAHRGLSPEGRVLGLFYGQGRCSRSRIVKLSVITGGAA